MKRVMFAGMIMILSIATFLTDGTASDGWTLKYNKEKTGISTLFFLDRNTGWAGGMTDNNGWKNIILRTTDGGETWHESPLAGLSVEYVRSLSFVDKNVGFCLAGDYDYKDMYSLYVTRNGGEYWERMNELPDSIITYSFCDENNGYAVVFGLHSYWRLLKTTDSGSTWQEQRTETDYQRGYFFDIECVSSDICYILFGSRFPYPSWYEYTYLDVTNDGGGTWTQLYSAGKQSYYHTAGRMELSPFHDYLWLLNIYDYYLEPYPNPGFFRLNRETNGIESVNDSLTVYNLRSFNSNEALFFVHAHPDYEGRDCLLYTYDKAATFEFRCFMPDITVTGCLYSGFSAPEKNIAWISTSLGQIYKYEHITDSVEKNLLSCPPEGVRQELV